MAYDVGLLSFRVHNKELVRFFNELGIKLEGIKGDVLTEKMTIRLPSGTSMLIDGSNNWSYPYLSEFESVSAWIIGLMLWEIEDDYQRTQDEYSAFSKELIDILISAQIIKLDWNSVDFWKRRDISKHLAIIDEYDAFMDTAEIEHVHGYGGQIFYSEKISINNGEKAQLSFSYDPWNDKDENPAVTGDDLWHALCEEEAIFDLAGQKGLVSAKKENWIKGKWVEAVSDEEMAQENEKERVFENDCKKLMASIIDNDEGPLKRLLVIHTRDCLTSEDPGSTTLASDITFNDLLNKGFFRFGNGPITEDIITQDCMIITDKEVTKDVFGKKCIVYDFTVVCKNQLCVLDSFKDRTIEICSILNDAANGKSIPGEGKIFYLMSYDFGSYVPVGYNGFHLVCATQKGKSKPGKNIISGYDKDIGAVIHELLCDEKIRKILSIDDMSSEEAYINGFVNASDINDINIQKGYESWVDVWWNPYGVSILPVSKGKKKLKELISVITKKVSGVKLPVRGKIKYDAKNSKKEIQLSEGYYTALLSFGK